MLDVWQNVLNEIKHNVSPAAFDTWFKGTRMISNSDGVVVIGVPGPFFIKNLESKYRIYIENALQKYDIAWREIHCVVDAREKKKIIPHEVIKTSGGSVNVMSELNERVPLQMGPSANRNTGLNPRYRFDNFIVGDNNNIAFGAAETITDRPGTRYNPLFIYSGPGLGKTHLIQAIGNEVIAKNPSARVLYTTIEQFVQTFIEAMRKKQNFTDKYRRVDVLIVDDIQFIAGKDRCQEEFFHTFNELYQAGKQIIISSDRTPSQIATIDERLVSRLSQGMCVDIQVPDYETRCAILKAKSDWDEIVLDDKIINHLAESVHTNIRELEGKYNQVVALMQIRNLSAEEIIDSGFLIDNRTSKIHNLTSRQIVERVAAYYRISVDEVYSKSRVKYIIIPRQIAMYIMKEDLRMSYPKIGMEFRQKDHTSAINAVKKIKRVMERDFQLREQISLIRQDLFVEK